jgi:hypothetical protein
MTRESTFFRTSLLDFELHAPALTRSRVAMRVDVRVTACLLGVSYEQRARQP